MSRRGLGFVEAVIAIAVLVTLTLPLVVLAVNSTRKTAGGRQRLVLELRARRYLAELATTTYDLLAVAGAAGPLPLKLGEANDDERGYACFVRGLTEETTVTETSRGLAEVQSTIAWDDGATGRHRQEVRVRRLIGDPTHSLRARYPMGVHDSL